MTVIDGVAEDSFPSHACVVPVSDEQLREISAGFVAEGLATGEHVVYFDDGSADGVLDRLADDRVPTAEPLSSGQLVVIPSPVTRRMLNSTADQVLSALDKLITGATEDGFPGVRITGDTSAGMRHGGAEMIEWEAGFDELIAGRPARIMCTYDPKLFAERDIEALRDVHHTELISPAVYDDGLLRITATGSSSARMAGEIDHTNRPRIRLLVAAALDHALRSHSSAEEIELDLSSLRFLDVAGAVSVVHSAEEFPSTHRLVLTGVRPGVHRLLDRCGAPFASQLQVEPYGSGTDALIDLGAARARSGDTGPDAPSDGPRHHASGPDDDRAGTPRHGTPRHGTPNGASGRPSNGRHHGRANGSAPFRGAHAADDGDDDGRAHGGRSGHGDRGGMTVVA